ncbi:MAG: O-antigen ligase family protein [Acidimicrobiales bacterium]
MEAGDGGPDVRASVAPLVLVGTLALSLGWQGAYYLGGQVVLGSGLLATAALTLLDGERRLLWRVASPEGCLATLALWAVVNAVLHGAGRAAGGVAMLVGAVVVTMVAVRRFDLADRAVLVEALPVVGGLVALSGWLGLIRRAPGWSQEADDLWRAAGSLSYSNALAAVLAMLTVLAMARLAHPGGGPGAGTGALVPSAVLSLIAAFMLTVTLATLSRAGLVALAAGLLVVLRGGWPAARAAAGPLAGAAIAFAALIPSLPATGGPRPVLATAGLLTGGAACAVVRRFAVRSPSLPRVPLAGPALVGSLVLGAAALTITVGPTLAHIAATRLGSSSNYRAPAAQAALAAWARRPMEGLGPGGATASWQDGTGALITLRYLHNEYLQVLVELGIVGALLLSATAVAAIIEARDARALDRWGLRLAGMAALSAFAVSSGLDIAWHVPAVPALAASIYAASLTPDSIRRSPVDRAPWMVASQSTTGKDHDA